MYLVVSPPPKGKMLRQGGLVLLREPVRLSLLTCVPGLWAGGHLALTTCDMCDCVPRELA